MAYMKAKRIYTTRLRSKSIPVRVNLEPEEWGELHEVKDRTGIPLGRLVADAVREVHLAKTDLGAARGVRSAGGQ